MSPAEPEDGIALTKRSWRFMEERAAGLGVGLRIVPLGSFLRQKRTQRAHTGQCLRIVEQAEALFRHLYAHKPFKEQLYPTAQPLKKLGLLRKKLAAGSLTLFGFHVEMLRVFQSMHDAHTNYGLPAPFLGTVAFLPFQVRAARDEDGQPGFFVTRILDSSKEGGFGHPTFGPGARIVTWDGAPMQQAVLRKNTLGGNQNALMARGLIRATIRPLWLSPPPPVSEEIVTVGYQVPGSKKRYKIDIVWGAAFGDGTATELLGGKAFSLNPSQAAIQSTDKTLWRPAQIAEERRVLDRLADIYGSLNKPASDPSPASASSDDPKVVSLFPKLLEFQHSGGDEHRPVPPGHLRDTKNPHKKLGYVRIRGFGSEAAISGEASALVDEFRRILKVLDEVAPDGLIVDIRGNPGGSVIDAEHMLQSLAPRPIHPAQFHLPNTPGVRAVLRHFGADSPAAFARWQNDRSIAAAPTTEGQSLSNSLAETYQLGQPYMGPVALLIDGSTYSAADIFAGGFSDNRVGTIIGVGTSTGGGGGVVIRHDELVQSVAGVPELGIRKLPNGVEMRVALQRSSRVRRNHGKPIEDAGVEADLVYLPAVSDIAGKFCGLFGFVCENVLGTKGVFRIELVEPLPKIVQGGIRLKVRTNGLNRLRFFVNGQEVLGSRIDEGPKSLSLLLPVKLGTTEAVQLLIQGLRPHSCVAVVSTGFTVREKPVPKSRFARSSQEREGQ